MAVLNKHADLKTKHAIAGHYRTDEQIYIEIAVAHDPEQYATMGTTVVNNDNEGSSIGASTGIQNINPNHSNESNNPSSLGMNLPKVRESNQGWYVTKEGRVFNANGYVYDGKTYFSGSLYQVGSLPAQDTRQEGNAEKVYVAIQNDTSVVREATGTDGSSESGTSSPTGESTIYSIGDTVTIGGETFYVIEDSDANTPTVKLLTAMNVETITFTQSSDANTVSFRDDWEESDANQYEVSDIRKLVEGDITNENNGYKQFFEQRWGKIVQEARLMTLAEVEALGGDLEGYTTEGCIGRRSFVNGLDYWLGSPYADSTGNACCVRGSDSTLTYDNVDNPGNYGLRPIIVVLKSNI